MKRYVCAPIVLVAMLAVLLSAVPAVAVGLKVSPDRIQVEIPVGGSAVATLRILNDERSDVTYQMYVKGDQYKGWFAFESTEFTLAPEESKTIQVTISLPAAARGDHKAYVRARTFQGTSGVAIGAGVKVPVYISIIGEQEPSNGQGAANLSLISGAIAAFAAVIIVLALIRWRRRRAT